MTIVTQKLPQNALQVTIRSSTFPKDIVMELFTVSLFRLNETA
ncbi:MAG TPA: hypothetical protein VK029_07530 [Pseudogracilibacillus sp.]|nr:hypothetical protein [Pseudogracilibacillus sp.]